MILSSGFRQAPEPQVVTLTHSRAARTAENHVSVQGDYNTYKNKTSLVSLILYDFEITSWSLHRQLHSRCNNIGILELNLISGTRETHPTPSRGCTCQSSHRPIVGLCVFNHTLVPSLLVVQKRAAQSDHLHTHQSNPLAARHPTATWRLITSLVAV